MIDCKMYSLRWKKKSFSLRKKVLKKCKFCNQAKPHKLKSNYYFRPTRARPPPPFTLTFSPPGWSQHPPAPPLFSPLRPFYHGKPNCFWTIISYKRRPKPPTKKEENSHTINCFCFFKTIVLKRKFLVSRYMLKDKTLCTLDYSTTSLLMFLLILLLCKIPYVGRWKVAKRFKCFIQTY